MRLVLAFLAVTALHAADLPVVVELFTSEGCSSCPPADELLAKLEKVQPIPGARIIVLSEHVDYWNSLGWRDPYSSNVFTDRQRQYTASLNENGPYTPEAVVDGRAGFIGSDGPAAKKAIVDSLKLPKAKVTLVAEAVGAGINIKVDIADLAGTKDADVILAITETNIQTAVRAGENSGRLLKHTGVVRRLTTLGQVKGTTYATQTSLSLPKEWKRENLHAVVFVQDRKTRHILGAATTDEMPVPRS